MKQICLVTGASRGIGRATSEHLSQKGYIVYAGMRATNGHNSHTAKQLANCCHIIDLDVTDSASIKSAVKKITNNEGRIDVLINNAGVGAFSSIEETGIGCAREIFEVNFFGSLRMCQEIIPHMREQGSGIIVQLSSIGGLISGPFHGIYQASKHAIEAISETMAYELNEFGIRVIIIEPGSLNNNFIIKKETPTSSVYQSLAELTQACPSNPITPSDVAKAIYLSIEQRNCQLRVTVGEDALHITQKRKELSDNEFSRWLLDRLRNRDAQ